MNKKSKKNITNKKHKKSANKTVKDQNQAWQDSKDDPTEGADFNE